MNGVSPQKARQPRRVVIMLLLLLLITFGTFMGVSLGVFIAGGLNRWPTVTILIPPNNDQLTMTSTTFVKQFKDDIYARVTQLAQTKTPVATKK